MPLAPGRAPGVVRRGQPRRDSVLTTRTSTGVAFVFISLFPWVSFGTNQRDSQPWALALALLFLFVSIRTPINTRFLSLLLFVPAVVSVALWNSSQFDFVFYRGIYGYTSVPVLIVAYYVYVKNHGFPLRLVKVANAVYLFAAALQVWLGAGITRGLAPIRTTADRGVPSLAAEPTYFGVLLVFLTWIILVCTGYRPRRSNLLLATVNIIFVIFVAKSSMTIVFLAVAIALVVLYQFRPGLYSGIALSAVSVAAGYSLFLQNTRVGALVDIVLSRGLRDLILSDASINVRLAHVVLPWYAAISTLFVPNGFSAFSDAYFNSKPWHGGLFWYSGETNTIMSYAGAFVFELGLVGLVFLGYVFGLVLKDNRLRVFELVFLFTLLNSAIPVASPLVPLFVVLLYSAGPRGLNATFHQSAHESSSGSSSIMTAQ